MNQIKKMKFKNECGLEAEIELYADENLSECELLTCIGNEIPKSKLGSLNNMMLSGELFIARLKEYYGMTQVC